MNQFGYAKSQTMIEMLMVLGVFTILTSMVLGFSRTGEAQGKLSRQVDLLVTDIRRTQENAYFSRAIGGIMPCGYGLLFSTSSYAMQKLTAADCSQQNTFTFSNADDVPNFKRTFTAPVRISAMSSNPIAFVHPVPAVIFYPDAQEAYVTFSVGSEISRTVIINKFGGIQIQ